MATSYGWNMLGWSHTYIYIYTHTHTHTHTHNQNFKIPFTMCNIMSHYNRTRWWMWSAQPQLARTNIQDPPQPLLTDIIWDMADCSVHSHTTSPGHLKFTLRSRQYFVCLKVCCGPSLHKIMHFTHQHLYTRQHTITAVLNTVTSIRQTVWCVSVIGIRLQGIQGTLMEVMFCSHVQQTRCSERTVCDKTAVAVHFYEVSFNIICTQINNNNPKWLNPSKARNYDGT